MIVHHNAVRNDRDAAAMMDVALPKKPRPNRIFELTKARRMTYADVAAKVREIAAAQGDQRRADTHEVTINRLSLGTTKLTQDWMRILGVVFDVPAEAVIALPQMEGLRLVRVTGSVEAGAWSATGHTWAEDEQYDVTVPDDAAMKPLTLYAKEVRGESMNLRYREGSIVVMSRLRQEPGEIVEGRHYHVRVERADGQIEDTVKTLTKDAKGRYWLRPESNAPDYQTWQPLDPEPGTKLSLLGRVRFVVQRED